MPLWAAQTALGSISGDRGEHGHQRTWGQGEAGVSSSSSGIGGETGVSRLVGLRGFQAVFPKRGFLQAGEWVLTPQGQLHLGYEVQKSLDLALKHGK